MVDEVPTIEASSRSSAQAKIDLKEVDEIVHEFTRTQFPQLAARKEHLPSMIPQSHSWTEESSNSVRATLCSKLSLDTSQGKPKLYRYVEKYKELT
jgi:hypothetical protein